MFRDGGSEYAINGTRCRLLDIQELLSDSGIGREMHVIVGQGQLDAVLQAAPEDRRGFIEEAAGVLKHRKRKEKALRKLDAMQANLTRLNDLTAELRRQLKPLGRQAEVARRAAVVQADLRDSRLRLLADDLVTLRGTLERARWPTRTPSASAAPRSRPRSSSPGPARAELEQAAADAPRWPEAQETWYRLSSPAASASAAPRPGRRAGPPSGRRARGRPARARPRGDGGRGRRGAGRRRPGRGRLERRAAA